MRLLMLTVLSAAAIGCASAPKPVPDAQPTPTAERPPDRPHCTDTDLLFLVLPDANERLNYERYMRDARRMFDFGCPAQPDRETSNHNIGESHE